jgi:tetratricopeptide (TPR) repeat protein
MVPSFFMNDHVAQEIQVRRLVSALRWGLLALVVVAAGGGGYYFWKSQKQKAAEKAFDLLHAATKLEERAGREGSSLQKDAMEVLLAWPEAQKQEYLKALEAVEAQYSKKSAGLLATLKKARFLFLSGNFEASLEGYKSVLERTASNRELELYQSMAAEGAAASFESLGKFGEAKTLLNDVLKTPNLSLKPLLFLSLARIHLQLGEKDQAAKTYDRVIQEFPNTDYEKRARVLKLRAG